MSEGAFGFSDLRIGGHFIIRAAGWHPDHDTLATFRRRFFSELDRLFVQVLELAQEMKLLKLGSISLDGAKIKANASRHSALSLITQ